MHLRELATFILAGLSTIASPYPLLQNGNETESVLVIVIRSGSNVASLIDPDQRSILDAKDKNITLFLPDNGSFNVSLSTENQPILSVSLDNVTQIHFSANESDSYEGITISDLINYHILPNISFHISSDFNSSIVLHTRLETDLLPSAQSGSNGSQVIIAEPGMNGSVILKHGAYPPITVNSSLSLNATNGVIDMIDHVLVPPSSISTAAKNLNLTSFSWILQCHPNLQDTMDSTPGLLVFVPSDEAFAQASDQLLNMTHRQLLHVLANHVVQFGNSTVGDLGSNGPTVFYAAELDNSSKNFTTVSGDSVSLLLGANSTVTVTMLSSNNSTVNATVLDKDVLTSNGVIQVIDKVLIPKDI